MTIKVFKLINGEEIFTKVTSEEGDVIATESPATIVIHDQGNGKAGLGMAPYMPYIEDKKVTIAKSAVASYGEPDESLSAEYNRLFGSGLVIPQPQKIIGA